MSFMAVAYSPAYIEDYMQFIKEKRNGLYGATAMIISNFLVGLPYLCMSLPPLSLPHKFSILTCRSHLRPRLLLHILLAHQLPTNRTGLLHLGPLGLSGPARG